MAQKITPEQMAAQWRTLPNKFEVNVLNFEVEIGKDAVGIFRKSFYLKRLNAPGVTPWPERLHHYPHEMLDETGNLKRSLAYKRVKRTRSQGVMVYCDPRVLMNSNRQKTFFNYSRIHNFGGMAEGATGSAANIAQRQFVGHSAYIKDALYAHSITLFNGFPK